jgi:hypothetical protein
LIRWTPIIELEHFDLTQQFATSESQTEAANQRVKWLYLNLPLLAILPVFLIKRLKIIISKKPAIQVENL